MAFNKTLIKNKKTLSYWKVTGYNVSVISKRAAFFLCGYIDQTDRTQDEGHPGYLMPVNILDQTKFDELFSVTEMDKLSNNPIKAIYKYLKENVDDFKDAVDV